MGKRSPHHYCCMTGYRHFHLKKVKVKQGFIYENAQKKVLENCNFCPGKSLKRP